MITSYLIDFDLYLDVLISGMTKATVFFIPQMVTLYKNINDGLKTMGKSEAWEFTL